MNTKTALALMAATMALTSHAANTDTNDNQTTNAAARITTGNIVKQNSIKSDNPNLSITEYHIDEDGDGRTDVIRQFIHRDGNLYMPQKFYSPFTVVEIIETYDEKHHMWNITNITKIGNRKPLTAPIYNKQQKTR